MPHDFSGTAGGLAAEVPTHNFTLYQGATFRRVIEYRDADGTTRVPLSGMAGRMQIRNKAGGSLVLDVPVEVSQEQDPAHPECGVIRLYASAEVTAEVTSDGVYDLEIYDPEDPTEVSRLLMGKVTVSRQVTR